MVLQEVGCGGTAYLKMSHHSVLTPREQFAEQIKNSNFYIKKTCLTKVSITYIFISNVTMCIANVL